MDSKERNHIDMQIILSAEALSGCIRLTRLFQSTNPDLTPEDIIRHGFTKEIEPLLETMHNLSEEEWKRKIGDIDARSSTNVAGQNRKHLRIEVALTLEAMIGCFRLTKQIKQKAPHQTFSDTIRDLINIYVVPSFLEAHKLTEEEWQIHMDYFSKFRRVNLAVDLPVDAYTGALRAADACKRDDPEYSVEDVIRSLIKLEVVPELLKMGTRTEEEWQRAVAYSDWLHENDDPDRATEHEAYHDGPQQEIVR